MNLYQVNWKYRDEFRPRFGLLRAREFLDEGLVFVPRRRQADLRRTYQDMYDAYARVFTRCGLQFRAVEGEAGEIGGDVNHEFMAVADGRRGRLRLVHELRLRGQRRGRAASRRRHAARTGHGRPSMRRRARRCTRRTCPASPAWPSTSVPRPAELLKCIAFDLDGELGLALVPGDREVNPYALTQAVAPRRARLFDDDDFERHPELPEGLHRARTTPARRSSSPTRWSPPPHDWITGANEIDHHVLPRRARPRLRGRALGRSGERRERRPVPARRPRALGRPRHRGRAGVPARNQVLGGARRAVHRRGG